MVNVYCLGANTGWSWAALRLPLGSKCIVPEDGSSTFFRNVNTGQFRTISVDKIRINIADESQRKLKTS